MATLIEKFQSLNQADLAGLKQRIAALRAAAEADLKRAGINPNQTATSAEIAKAASAAGLSVEEFMAALEQAKRMMG